MSMYRPHWIPDTHNWSSPMSTATGTTPSRSTPPGSHSPPKEHDLPPSGSAPPPASSSSSSVSTKLETNYESLSNNHEIPTNSDETAKEVKAEAESAAAAAAAAAAASAIKHNYSDYYQQHYNPHNDLSSAFINCNSASSSGARSASNLHPQSVSAASVGSARPSANSKSNKNRPNAGKIYFQGKNLI